MATSSTSTPRISLLNWNIYGLNPRHLEERTKHICDYILSRSPSVVFLQEVVHSTGLTITSMLGEHYHYYFGTPRAHYFNGLLVRKSPDIVILSDKEEYIPFPTSGMGRYLIGVTTRCHGIDVHFMTTHIESLDAEHNVTERKKQLKMAFDKMVELSNRKPVPLLCVFGGDLNTEDTEIREIGRHDSIIDIWEACGSKRSEKRTWNTQVPVKRYDRIYMCPCNGLIEAVNFCLFGTERVGGVGCYPSDHFGVWIEFKI